MPEFANMHTCRDWDALHAWKRGRDASDSAVWRKNADRIKAGGR